MSLKKIPLIEALEITNLSFFNNEKGEWVISDKNTKTLFAAFIYNKNYLAEQLRLVSELRAENERLKAKNTELQERVKELSIPANAPHSTALRLQQENERLKKQIDEFWDGLKHSYYIESREELEAIAKKCWNPPNPLLVALHHIWKRDAKIQWIPVSEQLPEVKKDVLVFAGGDKGDKLVYHAQMLCDNKFYACEDQARVFSVTHWAEITLPEGEGK